MLQPTTNAARVASAAIQVDDLDSDTTAQDVDADELLDQSALAQITSSATGSRPFLRDNWLARKTSYRMPWLLGYENWVYLLLLAAVAAGLWWHFKKK